jgi:beta-glucosidase
MQKMPRTTFPKRFLWGAASSAHQVEGGQHNQWTVWELENAKGKAAQASYQYGDLEHWSDIAAAAEDPNNYVSGDADDHYNRYAEDFDLLEEMNMNALRFSVEWSRVEPEEGAWDAAAVTHYKKYVAELRRRGIEPVVTLFHYTLPVWFAAKGGFAKRSNVQYFVRFAERIVRELGRDVRLVLTINEPVVYAYQSYFQGDWPPNERSKWKTWCVVNNLARAHNQAAAKIHAINRRYKVSVAKDSVYFYAGDDAWLSVKSARIMQYIFDDYFLKKIAKHCDFLGVNYYLSERVYGYRMHNPNKQVSDLGWDMSPENIQFALERLHEKYRLPILITENGLADDKDEYRQWWIAKTLAGMQLAMDNGVILEGYLHWSLTDNFEWDKGFWPRFGLAEVDYATGKRTLRPSAVWFGKVIRRLRNVK